MCGGRNRVKYEGWYPVHRHGVVATHRLEVESGGLVRLKKRQRMRELECDVMDDTAHADKCGMSMDGRKGYGYGYEYGDRDKYGDGCG